ncbi:MAG: glycosyltransferase [Coriobacteriia bacterium]|nr:glycosyltransferase [Coriobacteriia bacterium]
MRTGTSQPLRIALAYAAVGSGHRLVAESVQTAISVASPVAETALFDCLSRGPASAWGSSAALTYTGAAGALYDAVWGSKLAGAVGRPLASAIGSAVLSQFIAELRAFEPDVVVATHALPALLAVRNRRAGRLKARTIASVVTDWQVHAYWPRHGVDMMCVPSEAAALTFGTGEPRPTVTGIPVREQFLAPPSKPVARASLDIGSDSRVVLVLAGSKQAAPYAALRRSLALALPEIAKQADEIILLAGDDEYAFEMSRALAGAGGSRLRVLRYVEDVAVLMAAADLGIIKPGGVASAECVACGLPTVVVGPAFGQERANARVLAGAGASAYVERPDVLAECVGRLLADTPVLERMREACCDLRRPDAATRVAELVLGCATGS